MMMDAINLTNIIINDSCTACFGRIAQDLPNLNLWIGRSLCYILVSYYAAIHHIAQHGRASITSFSSANLVHAIQHGGIACHSNMFLPYPFCMFMSSLFFLYSYLFISYFITTFCHAHVHKLFHVALLTLLFRLYHAVCLKHYV